MIFIRKYDQLARLETLGCTRLRTVVILGSVRSRARLAGGVVLDYVPRVMRPGTARERIPAGRAKVDGPALRPTPSLTSNAA